MKSRITLLLIVLALVLAFAVAVGAQTLPAPDCHNGYNWYRCNNVYVSAVFGG
jgi:hypothetical protein